MCVSVLLGCAVVAGSVVLCDAGFLKFGSSDCVDCSIGNLCVKFSLLIGVFAGLFYTVLSRVINMELNPLLLDDMDALFLNSRRRRR